MNFVGANDPLDQRMPNYIAFAELNNRDTIHAPQCAMRLQQPGVFVRRQINLRFVSGDDRL